MAVALEGIKKDRVVDLGDLQGELNIQTSPVTISITDLLRNVNKKAPKWFTSRGLQLPKLVQTIIDANNSISNPSEKSNLSDEKISDSLRSAEMDKQYLDAVNRGDMEAAG